SGAANQNPVTFDERQIGGDDSVCPGQQRPNRSPFGFAPQPCEHSARFRIKSHRAPRSSSSNSELERRPKRVIKGYSFGWFGLPGVSRPARTRSSIDKRRNRPPSSAETGRSSATG